MTEQLPEETMAIVASDADPAELPDELIDELLAGARTPEEITSPAGLLQRLMKRLVERARWPSSRSTSATRTARRRPVVPATRETGCYPKTVRAYRARLGEHRKEACPRLVPQYLFCHLAHCCRARTYPSAVDARCVASPTARLPPLRRASGSSTESRLAPGDRGQSNYRTAGAASS